MYSIRRLEKELKKENSKIFNEDTMFNTYTPYMKKHKMTVYVPFDKWDKYGYFIIITDNKNIIRFRLNGNISSLKKQEDIGKIIADFTDKNIHSDKKMDALDAYIMSIISWKTKRKKYLEKYLIKNGGEIKWKY